MRMIPVGNSGNQGGLSSAAVDRDLEATATGRLRRAGQRFTHGRRALVEALAKADRPVTTEEILRLEPRLPLSTTYRNLAILQQAGIVHRVSTDHEFARFELAEDLTDRHHHHLVCESCGTIEDVEIPARLDRSVRGALDGLAGQSGFRVGSHRVDAFGLCARCAAERR
jgi:Fur family ferric uptake transcriptional regulator